MFSYTFRNKEKRLWNQTKIRSIVIISLNVELSSEHIKEQLDQDTRFKIKIKRLIFFSLNGDFSQDKVLRFSHRLAKCSFRPIRHYLWSTRKTKTKTFPNNVLMLKIGCLQLWNKIVGRNTIDRKLSIHRNIWDCISTEMRDQI